MTVWSFFVLRENKPHVLDDLPSADTDAKRVARENGLRQEVSNGEAEEEAREEEEAAPEPASNGSPEPEICTDQQPLETQAEPPAEQTDRSNVEPQVRCFTFIIFTIFFFIFLIFLDLP